MTREEIYLQCVQKIDNSTTYSPCLLLEAATGLGKSKIAIDLVNHIVTTKFTKDAKCSMLLLVAKRVHKQTWKDEFEKWGGVKIDRLVIECYESLHKHTGESFDFVLMDEVHHMASDIRLDALKTVDFHYMIGLSATIPKKLKMLFKYKYHSEIVSCDIVEAIEDDVLPEPQILLFPLMLDNRQPTETLELNAKEKGPIAYGEYKDVRKYKKSKQHAILKCTQKQKLIEYDKLIEWFKQKTMQTRNPAMERSWLYQAGKRLEFLANCKNQIVSDILKKLDKERTITFCKTIEQSEILGKYCIHSHNSASDTVYELFNKKRINHITAVNILNENANLVDCKYAIFANISSSDIVIPQRLGRAMRHSSPVIIIPYYVNTREEEIVKKMIGEERWKGAFFTNKAEYVIQKGALTEYTKVIHSIQEI